MALSSIIFLVCLAWLASTARAYGIDSSCPDPDFIEDSADAAIRMASYALDALEPPDGAARDPNVERLIDLLFRGSEAVDESTLIKSLIKVYSGVARFGARTDLVRPDGRRATGDTVNIFCNLDRVQKREIDGQYVDTSTEMVLKDFNDHELNSCKTISADLAVTWAPRYSIDSNLWIPSQVTICPWFYQWAHTREITQWTDLRVKSGIAVAAIPLLTTRIGWPFTPIDAINLLDKVLLHEFTHTHAAGGLIDVPMTVGGAPGFDKAYGWNAATALAKQQDNDRQKSPLRNSDSFALFASGVRLLRSDPPIYIQDSGTTTTTRISKRSVPRELQYKQTPAAFEGFVTRIRAELAAATVV